MQHQTTPLARCLRTATNWDDLLACATAFAQAGDDRVRAYKVFNDPLPDILPSREGVFCAVTDWQDFRRRDGVLRTGAGQTGMWFARGGARPWSALWSEMGKEFETVSLATNDPETPLVTLLVFCQ